MLFVLSESEEVDWPVTIPKPVDGGKTQDHKITARFRLIPQDKADDIVERNHRRPDMALMQAVLIGWGDDVQDDKGKPLPFSEKTRDQLLNIGYVRIALVRAYHEANLGAKPKN